METMAAHDRWIKARKRIALISWTNLLERLNLAGELFKSAMFLIEFRIELKYHSAFRVVYLS